MALVFVTTWNGGIDGQTYALDTAAQGHGPGSAGLAAPAAGSARVDAEAVDGIRRAVFSSGPQRYKWLWPHLREGEGSLWPTSDDREMERPTYAVVSVSHAACVLAGDAACRREQAQVTATLLTDATALADGRVVTVSALKPEDLPLIQVQLPVEHRPAVCGVICKEQQSHGATQQVTGPSYEADGVGPPPAAPPPDIGLTDTLPPCPESCLRDLAAQYDWDVDEMMAIGWRESNWQNSAESPTSDFCWLQIHMPTHLAKVEAVVGRALGVEEAEQLLLADPALCTAVGYAVYVAGGRTTGAWTTAVAP